ncbi:ABC transporter ATP-binding protein [uncultured Roseobacter sp.]|uniref:ABC transporter ATP-binding protein n=1 Tax=uncultured Roseobacter sp. TaxID=114847 RepID=UPI00262D789C|nr:ABC transporter ATP-binding protein [uncultured Roseobacter sp.]
MNDPLALRVSGLTKAYTSGGAKVPVLEGVSFSMQRGETLALVGESGSGKSTVLHLIAGLDRPCAGSIEISGVEVAGMSDADSAAMRRGTVGLVFQQFNLIPSLTVAGNIAFHARLSGRNDPDRNGELAARLGLEDHLGKYPETLSGGQQQRVAIARTLACRPALILADEPTGNLDEATADRVLDLLLDTARDAGAAVLMVTHSARHAGRMNRQLTLSRGRIVQGRAGEAPDQRQPA